MLRRGSSLIPILTILLSGVCAEASRLEPPSLEKKLKSYLHQRLLVFRQMGVAGSKVHFNSIGQLTRREPGTAPSGRTGILYMDLELKPERMLIVGEPVRIVANGGKRPFVRDPRRLDLMTCTLALDVPEKHLTFEKAVAILAKVFLTKREFDEVRGVD